MPSASVMILTKEVFFKEQTTIDMNDNTEIPAVFTNIWEDPPRYTLLPHTLGMATQKHHKKAYCTLQSLCFSLPPPHPTVPTIPFLISHLTLSQLKSYMCILRIKTPLGTINTVHVPVKCRYSLCGLYTAIIIQK